jgi:mannitol 2-dehydrogenase/sorbose reductase
VGIGVSGGPDAARKAAVFHAQDYLYTVTEYDEHGTPSPRVIGALLGYLSAADEPERVLALLSSPELHIVTLTITEGGYFIDKATGGFTLAAPEIQSDAASQIPTSVFGLLVRALELRRAADIPAFSVVSCDNLAHNGEKARQAVIGFAEARDPDLATWIKANVAFPNSMVDRVAPYVSEVQREQLNAATGIADALAVTGESYIEWVLEDRFSDGRPALERVGVTIVGDAGPYETVKLRLLNAPHVLMAYPSILAGYRLVHEAVSDPTIHGLLEDFIRRDVIPGFQGAPAHFDLEAYASTTMARFSNPAIGDQLLRVATDGASKIPIFHAVTARKLAQEGRDLTREILLLACYRRYLLGRDDHGVSFQVSEPTLPAPERTAIISDPHRVLSIPAFQPLGLADSPIAPALLLEIDSSLDRDGALATIRRYS